MKFKSVSDVGDTDYDGKLAVVLLSPGCNYSCGYCHSKNLLDTSGNGFIPEEIILKNLDVRKNWIERIVLCGGEPTLQPDIAEFAKKLKDKGFLVKLDTNGSNPDVIKDLMKKQLVDYVAMDVKGPKNLYPLITRTNTIDTAKLEESMRIVPFFPGYEFRTTVIPIVKDYGTDFMTIDDIVKTAEWINEATRSARHKYYLQPFEARAKEEMGDERLSLEVLPKELQKTPQDLLARMKEAVYNILPGVEIR